MTNDERRRLLHPAQFAGFAMTLRVQWGRTDLWFTIGLDGVRPYKTASLFL